LFLGFVGFEAAKEQMFQPDTEGARTNPSGEARCCGALFS
jgi:hypothetical protein